MSISFFKNLDADDDDDDHSCLLSILVLLYNTLPPAVAAEASQCHEQIFSLFLVRVGQIMYKERWHEFLIPLVTHFLLRLFLNE